MLSVKSRINDDGRVLVPAAMRKALGIRPGQTVTLTLEDDAIRLSTVQRQVRRAQQQLRRYLPEGTSLVDELLSERRREARRE
jgi:AbrB family looped-hinge helix DNA binding protein